MPRNGSGTYNLPSPPTPWVTGTTISAPDMNTALNDIASAMTQSVSADGQTPMTGDLNMGGHNITNGGTINASGYTLSGLGIFNLVRGYLSGMTLSNDGSTPNTTIDVSAGVCVSSASSAFITFASTFTKNTSGAWTAGSGNAGMGQGLTVGNNTWYHVFAIINGGTSDIYFDTSVSAANAPAGTTASRRIGSVKTDGSAHILTFVQNGDLFLWGVDKGDQNLVGTFSSSPTLLQLSVPLGVNVEAIMSVTSGNGSAAWSSTLYSPLVTTATGIMLQSTSVGVQGCQAAIMTNTSSQIKAFHTSAALGNLTITTSGWKDTRGRFA